MHERSDALMHLGRQPLQVAVSAWKRMRPAVLAANARANATADQCPRVSPLGSAAERMRYPTQRWT